MGGQPLGAVVAELAELAVPLVGDDRLGIDDLQADERGEERRIGLLQRELDGERIDRLDLLDAIDEQAGKALTESDQAIVGEDHVGGGERVAGMEFDPVAELEGVGLAVGAPFAGEQRLDPGRTLLRENQRVVDVHHQDSVAVIRRLGRIDLADRRLVEAENSFGESRRGDEHRCGQQAGEKAFSSGSHFDISL